jgi:hypothetical protein
MDTIHNPVRNSAQLSSAHKTARRRFGTQNSLLILLALTGAGMVLGGCNAPEVLTAKGTNIASVAAPLHPDPATLIPDPVIPGNKLARVQIDNNSIGSIRNALVQFMDTGSPTKAKLWLNGNSPLAPNCQTSGTCLDFRGAYSTESDAWPTNNPAFITDPGKFNPTLLPGLNLPFLGIQLGVFNGILPCPIGQCGTSPFASSSVDIKVFPEQMSVGYQGLVAADGTLGPAQLGIWIPLELDFPDNFVKQITCFSTDALPAGQTNPAVCALIQAKLDTKKTFLNVGCNYLDLNYRINHFKYKLGFIPSINPSCTPGSQTNPNWSWLTSFPGFPSPPPGGQSPDASCLDFSVVISGRPDVDSDSNHPEDALTDTTHDLALGYHLNCDTLAEAACQEGGDGNCTQTLDKALTGPLSSAIYLQLQGALQTAAVGQLFSPASGLNNLSAILPPPLRRPSSPAASPAWGAVLSATSR